MSDLFAADRQPPGIPHWRRYDKLLRAADAGQAIVQCLAGIRTRAMRRARTLPRQRVLLAAVEVPGREADLKRITDRLARSRHGVTIATIPMQGRGKLANINAALTAHDPDCFDWLLITDDDVDFDPPFLDLLLAEAACRGFRLAMPAHRQWSFSSFPVTRRHWAAASRRVGYVEVGPVTLFHRSVFKDLIPFPESRWAWGVDVLWAQIAERRGWAIGVIDVATVRHLRPVAASYRAEAARAEAEALLRVHAVDTREATIMRNLKRYF